MNTSNTTKFTPGFWKCRDGSKAEIFKETDEKLWGRAFTDYGPTATIARSWGIDGRWIDNGHIHPYDLVGPWQNGTKVISEWINVYPHGFGNSCPSRKSCDTLISVETRIDCRRVSYTRGGLVDTSDLLRKAADAYNECNLKGPTPTNVVHLTKLKAACLAYLEAWGKGRIVDTTEDNHE